MNLRMEMDKYIRMEEIIRKWEKMVKIQNIIKSKKEKKNGTWERKHVFGVATSYRHNFCDYYQTFLKKKAKILLLVNYTKSKNLVLEW